MNCTKETKEILQQVHTSVSANCKSNLQTVLMDYFSARLANNILLGTGEGEPTPPNLREQNSLFPAPKYKDTHSFGMFFVNTVTVTGDTFRTALPL